MQAFFFTIAFGLIATGLGIVCVNFWSKQSTLTINPCQTVIENRWLLLRRTRSFDTMNIRYFQIKGGMTSGERVFYSILSAGVFPASPEAEWLAQEMNHALGRPF